jgi:hypothetical protein
MQVKTKAVKSSELLAIYLSRGIVKPEPLGPLALLAQLDLGDFQHQKIGTVTCTQLRLLRPCDRP